MISSMVCSASMGMMSKCSHVLKNVNIAKRFLYDNISENISMEDVARHVGVGYSKFRKAFKQITGLSPNQYFIEMKLERSKTMLPVRKLRIVLDSIRRLISPEFFVVIRDSHRRSSATGIYEKYLWTSGNGTKYVKAPQVFVCKTCGAESRLILYKVCILFYDNLPVVDDIYSFSGVLVFHAYSGQVVHISRTFFFLIARCDVCADAVDAYCDIFVGRYLEVMLFIYHIAFVNYISEKHT